MRKQKTLCQLKEAGVIAVVRADSVQEAIAACHAAIAGGLTGIEVTYTTPDASEVIRTLVADYANQPEIVIGAGTVLEEVTTIEAINAGAKFVVSPCFDEESAKAMGIKTDKLGKIFIILIALCVVVSMRIVGVLLISSMMVIPVAAAMQYSLSFKQTIISSIIIAVISVIGGITLSFYFDLASGGTIVLISVIILIASILLKGRR